MTVAAPISLRERKKAKLRQVILVVSRRLFMERGYERTTLEQVCEDAETSLRTLLRYFPTKEDLALGREIAWFETFREELANRPPARTAIECWRERIRVASGEIGRGDFIKFVDFLKTAPSVAARLSSLQVEYEGLLAESFAQEAGVDPVSDLYGQLLAGMLVAGDRAVSKRWLAGGGREDIGRLRAEVIDWVVANFPSREQTSGERPAFGRRTLAPRMG